MRDLLSLPKMLVDIDSVADEFKSLYEIDGDGLYVLTQTAADNFDEIKDGIRELAEQRDHEARKAREASKSAAIMSAVLLAGAQGVMAAAACSQFEAEHTVTMTKGIPVVQTPTGEIPLRDMIAEWIKAGDGQIFLPQRQIRR